MSRASSIRGPRPAPASCLVRPRVSRRDSPAWGLVLFRSHPTDLRTLRAPFRTRALPRLRMLLRFRARVGSRALLRTGGLFELVLFPRGSRGFGMRGLFQPRAPRRLVRSSAEGGRLRMDRPRPGVGRRLRSGPVSRILSRLGLSARDGGDHSSSPAVARGIERPTRGLQPGQPQTPPYLVLLRVGFTLPAVSPRRRCALTAPFHPCHPRGSPRGFGGVFSVALSLRSPSLVVDQHAALWSPDFPPRPLSREAAATARPAPKTIPE